MSTALATVPEGAESITITITPETVTKLRDEATPVKLHGIDGIEWQDGRMYIRDASAMLADKEGQKAVKAMISKVVKSRTTCERERKAVKEDALSECRRIDQHYGALSGVIKEIEDDLTRMEKAIEDELDRRAAEKATKLFESRCDELVIAGAEPHHLDEPTIRRMDQDAFDRHLALVVADKARRVHEENERHRIAEEQRLERERLAAEAEKIAEQQRIESERIAAERAKLEAEQAIEREKLAEERRKIDAEAAEQRRRADEQAEALAAAKRELEHLARLQETALAADRVAEQNRLKAQQDAIYAQKLEMENRERIQREEQDRLQAEREAIEHEREFAQTRMFAEKMQSDADAVLGPYSKIKSIQEWHRVAAEEVLSWVVNNGGIADVTVDSIEACAAIICDRDPETDW